MDLLERAKQKLNESVEGSKASNEDSKKIPDSQEKKVTPGSEKDQKVAHPQPKKRSSQEENKSSKNNPGGHLTNNDNLSLTEKTSTDIMSGIIDQKINELVNKRLLKLVKSGLKHELTIENLVKYIKTHNGTKQYKLADYFEADIHEIERMIKYLHSSGVIKKDANNWYHLK
ncbi:MAG: hypothetical protein ACFFDF_22535 [Candidatus Odinarchaeota archaeon]